MCSGAVFVSERAKCKVIDKVFLFLICLNDIIWNCLPSTTQGLQTKNPNSPQPRTGACWNESTIPVLPIPSGGGASTITSVSGPRPCWSLSTGKDSLGFFSTSQKNGGFALQQISTALFQPRNKKADKKQPCGRKMMYLFDFFLIYVWFSFILTRKQVSTPQDPSVQLLWLLVLRSIWLSWFIKWLWKWV